MVKYRSIFFYFQALTSQRRWFESRQMRDGTRSDDATVQQQQQQQQQPRRRRRRRRRRCLAYTLNNDVETTCCYLCRRRRRQFLPEVRDAGHVVDVARMTLNSPTASCHLVACVFFTPHATTFRSLWSHFRNVDVAECIQVKTKSMFTRSTWQIRETDECRTFAPWTLPPRTAPLQFGHRGHFPLLTKWWNVSI